MASSAFYNVDPLDQIAINLFYGWGYNFYRKENQLRADDQLVRSKVGLLLGSARKSVELAEADFRREFLPPPSREKPRHDPAAVSGAQAIERLSREIGSLQSVINSQPVPENDRMTQRSREEGTTLQRLISTDQRLAGQSELLRSMLDQKNGAWILENIATIHEGTQAIAETLRNRQLLLFPTA